MSKLVSTLVLCAAGIATWAGLAAGGATVEADAPPGAPDEEKDAAAPRLEDTSTRAAPPPDAMLLGLRCDPVPAELAAHLGLDPGAGLLVAEVQESSPAQDAGLERFDVLLAIDGAPAHLASLEGAAASGRGVALRVARGGLEHDVAVAAPGQEGGDRFLSSASLGPDHPFRRLGRIEALRAGYAEKNDVVERRMRELQEETQAARRAAQEARAELLQSAKDEVRDYLEAREAELIGMVEQDLAPERTAALHALRVDLEEILPGARLEAVTQRLAALDEPLRAGLAGRVTLDGADEDAESVRRERRRLARIGEHAASLADGRVARAWADARSTVEEHRERLGPRHDSRMQWADGALAKIRQELRERITCAVDRAHESFSKQLSARLQKNEVPAPGEIDAMLTDLSFQLEHMTSRFVERTTRALDTYAHEVGTRERVLLPALAEHLTAGEQAAAEFSASVERVLDERASVEIVWDGTWRTTARLDALVDELEAALGSEVTAGRDAMRAETVAWSVALREERVLTDDAWEDLKRALGALQQAASNDCWKLDGPHLDGRFPREPADEGPKDGDVAMR